MLAGRNSLLLHPLHRALKRGADIAISLAVMVLLLWWLTPLLALFIVLNSRGPVFFAQKRTGYKNRTFWCYKFRTMQVNPDANREQATVDDQRITRVGHFLRETNLDELPQFWNVLKGDMSVIGPRPHMLRHTVEYAAKAPNYDVRHTVRPGITGLAQVRGFIGAIHSKEDLVNRVDSDCEYIESWTPMLDLRIFLRTAFGRFYKLPLRLRNRFKRSRKHTKTASKSNETAERTNTVQGRS